MTLDSIGYVSVLPLRKNSTRVRGKAPHYGNLFRTDLPDSGMVSGPLLGGS